MKTAKIQTPGHTRTQIHPNDTQPSVILFMLHNQESPQLYLKTNHLYNLYKGGWLLKDGSLCLHLFVSLCICLCLRQMTMIAVFFAFVCVATNICTSDAQQCYLPEIWTRNFVHLCVDAPTIYVVWTIHIYICETLQCLKQCQLLSVEVLPVSVPFPSGL